MDRNFEKGDFRKEYFKGDRKSELVERVGKLQEIVDGTNEVDSLVELAVRYVLSFDAVSSIIPGMRLVSYVEQNTQFSEKGALSAELLKKLEEHSWERNFYDGLDPWLEASGFIEA